MLSSGGGHARVGEPAGFGGSSFELGPPLLRCLLACAILHRPQLVHRALYEVLVVGHHEHPALEQRQPLQRTGERRSGARPVRCPSCALEACKAWACKAWGSVHASVPLASF